MLSCMIYDMYGPVIFFFGCIYDYIMPYWYVQYIRIVLGLVRKGKKGFCAQGGGGFVWPYDSVVRNRFSRHFLFPVCGVSFFFFFLVWFFSHTSPPVSSYTHPTRRWYTDYTFPPAQPQKPTKRKILSYTVHRERQKFLGKRRSFFCFWFCVRLIHRNQQHQTSKEEIVSMEDKNQERLPPNI